MNKNCPPRISRQRRRQLGVTLIEALVALLVMGFGMVALVELMTNLRRSGDLGKQRSEAMRIAQAEMASLRTFSVVAKPADAASNVKDFDTDIVSKPAYSTAPDDSNTSYTVSRTITPLVEDQSTLRAKSAQVVVSWQDRGGRKGTATAESPQTIVLDTVIARAEPAFGGAVGITPPPGGTRQPSGRSSVIPTTAKDLGNKTSVYRPSSLGSTVWVFNNVSGVITGICSIPPATSVATLTAADVTSCNYSQTGYLLSGTVRFSNASPANPTVPEATALQLNMAIVSATYQTPELDARGVPIKDSSTGNYIMRTLTASAPSHTCLNDGPTSLPSSQTYVNYDCIIYFNAGSPGNWSGKLTVAPTGFSIGTLATEYRVCRYSADYNGNGTPYVSTTVAYDNFEHPEVYVGVTGSLVRQNFLVVKGTSACPTAPAVDPAHGVFVDYSTRQLQPSL